MKKRIILNYLSTLLIILFLTGCGDASAPPIESTEQTLATENLAHVEATGPSETTITTEAVEEISTNPTDAAEAETETAENTVEPTEPVVEEQPMVEVNDDVLVNILDYIPNAIVDLKYATTDNFTGVQIYDSDMPAMLRYGTIKKLMLVQEELNSLGYTLVIWDAYRPTEAQFKLWEVCPNSAYVANPHSGFSSHSRGNTVDITVQTLDGQFVEMPTGFDDFSLLANRDYSDVSDTAAENAIMLENIMKEHGFKPYSGEWWHFSDNVKYDVVKHTQE